ncbi:hypothetical protein ACFYY2_31815 [Streptomyces sp. NPDC001822]|uniref:hypothetical protein n=1 Tax=Streptomyces sp. NPDC001822 TaxID=3364614 RepID=UPI003691DC3A
MQTVDGRPFATREDIMATSGYSRRSLATLWQERDSNGHPRPGRWAGPLHWDLELWSRWFTENRQQPRAPKEIDRSGHPDE